MVDFLKANPYVTRDEYLWRWTVPQATLAMLDYTHTVYLTEEQAKKFNAKKYNDPLAMVNDLGLPIF